MLWALALGCGTGSPVIARYRGSGSVEEIHADFVTETFQSYGAMCPSADSRRMERTAAQCAAGGARQDCLFTWCAVKVRRCDNEEPNDRTIGTCMRALELPNGDPVMPQR
jgi:hypothetical protein